MRDLNVFRVSDEIVILCLRVMVALIVVYDHIHPVGAFEKKSPFDVSTLTSCCESFSKFINGA